jgi:hypothetical protein
VCVCVCATFQPTLIDASLSTRMRSNRQAAISVCVLLEVRGHPACCTALFSVVASSSE